MILPKGSKYQEGPLCCPNPHRLLCMCPPNIFCPNRIEHLCCRARIFACWRRTPVLKWHSRRLKNMHCSQNTLCHGMFALWGNRCFEDTAHNGRCRCRTPKFHTMSKNTLFVVHRMRLCSNTPRLQGMHRRSNIARILGGPNDKTSPQGNRLIARMFVWSVFVKRCLPQVVEGCLRMSHCCSIALRCNRCWLCRRNPCLMPPNHTDLQSNRFLHNDVHTPKKQTHLRSRQHKTTPWQSTSRVTPNAEYGGRDTYSAVISWIGENPP
jgi:hypothetical protein